MKTPRIAAIVGALLLLRPPETDAQIGLFWDTNGSGGVQGGTGNWLGTANWNNVFPGNNVLWSHGSVAVFTATPGTVTVNGAVTANGLSFGVDGYNVTGGSTITLGGATPNISVTNAGTSATIGAPLGGTVGMTKIGDGTLNLTGTNTYTGPTTINAGMLVDSSSGNQIPDNSSVVIANVAGAGLQVFGESIGSLAGGGTTGGTVIVPSNSQLQVGFDNTSTTFAGVVACAGNFTKYGTGTIELTNSSNTFAQGIPILAGAVSVPNMAALGGAPSITLGGTLIYTGTASASSNADLLPDGGGINVASATGQLTMSGNYTGIGGNGFSKSGPGTLIFSGIGDYRGPTNIVGGKLRLNVSFDGDHVLPITSTVTLSDVAGAELQVGGAVIGGLAGGGPTGGNVVLQGLSGLTVGANDASTTFAGAISGPGNLKKVGTGTLTLNGAGAYTGSTTINAGTLRVGGGNAIPNGSDVTVSALGGATFDLNGSTETIRSLDGGGLVTLGSGTLTLLNAFTTFSGTISGTGGLTKSGSNTFTLSGTNTFTGPTTINGGILRVAGGSALSDLTAVTLANVAGATLDLNGSSETIGSLSGSGVTGGDVTLGSGTLTVGANNSSTTYSGNISGTGGSVVKTGAGTLTFDFIHTFTGDIAVRQGALSISAVTNAGTSGLLGAGSTIILGGSGTMGTLLFTSAGADSTNRALGLSGGGGVIDVSDSSGALTISGVVTGSGGLAKLGPGTLLLSGSNTSGGPTTVSAGRLQLSGGNAIGDGSAVTLADAAGALIELVAGNETIGSLAGGGASGGNVMLGSATLTVGGDGTSTNYAGALSGSGGLTKTGAGVLTLSGANAFTGPAVIDGGTLRTAGGSALADTAAVVVAAGATLDLNNGSEAIGSLAGNGLVTLGSGTLTTGASNGSTTFAGAISGSGGLTKTGAGTFTLTGPNNFTGPTSVAAGTLALENGLGTPGGALNVGAGGAVQARGSVNRAITGAGTISATGTLFLGDAASASGFAFAGTLAADTHLIVLADADAAELGTATTLGAGARLLSLNGAVLGNGESVTVSAGVSASIGGAFTNNGTVNGPTLAGQKLTFTDDVNGTGSFTGNVLFSDGFSPGASPAAVSLENFAFDGTTTLSIEIGGVIAGSQFDRLNFTGTGALDGALSVSLIGGFQPQHGNSFTFLQGGTIAGTFDSVNLPALNPGLQWSQANLYTAGEIAVALNLAFTSRTWDGGGADNDWSTNHNWSIDVQPLNNATADLIFAGTVRLAPSVDTPWNVRSITFDSTSGAFDIAGPQTVTVGVGGITNNDADLQSITAPITLATSESFTAAAGDLAFTSVNIGANTLTIAGANDVELGDVTGTGTITKTSTGALEIFGTIGAGGITLNASAGETHIAESQTLAALSIGNGATVTLGAIAPAEASEPGAGGTLSVPEPGVGLLLLSALALLGTRRRKPTRTARCLGPPQSLNSES